MIQIIAFDELIEFIIKPIKDIAQTIIESFEAIQKLTEELKDIPEEKETYLYAFYQTQYIMPKVKFKRLWKRQKIP